MSKEEIIKELRAIMTHLENYDKANVILDTAIEMLESYKNEEDKIFLLSKEGYKKYASGIPQIKCDWWLRSSGYGAYLAIIARPYGPLCYYGARVNDGDIAVRPALKYDDLEIIKSKEEECFIWNETKWKIIDEENKIAISYMPIDFRRFDETSNEYKNSEIRQWLLEWYERGKENE